MGVRGQLSVPSAVLGAEMAGVSLYGSFRTGLVFGGGKDTAVANFGSRWGIRGSAEVSEGLTASYKYEGKINTTNAEFGGGVGHAHDEFFVDLGNTRSGDSLFSSTAVMDEDGVVVGTGAGFLNKCTRGKPFEIKRENKDKPDEITGYESIGAETEDNPTDGGATITCGNLIDEDDNSGPGGRLSYVSLSGGFGSITAGQIWSASANHYGFAVDPSVFNGSFGGASGRPGNTISYSSSAGDVSFQIDKVTGDGERIEFGASAALGPVGLGLGYWSNANDKKNFTGVAISAGAGGVGLSIGLGNSDNDMGESKDTTVISVSGALGDSGISYGVQVVNSDIDENDQNLVSLVNTLGPGASIVFEHVDPGGDKESFSNLALKVDF